MTFLSDNYRQPLPFFLGINAELPNLKTRATPFTALKADKLDIIMGILTINIHVHVYIASAWDSWETFNNKDLLPNRLLNLG